MNICEQNTKVKEKIITFNRHRPVKYFHKRHHGQLLQNIQDQITFHEGVQTHFYLDPKLSDPLDAHFLFVYVL